MNRRRNSAADVTFNRNSPELDCNQFRTQKKVVIIMVDRRLHAVGWLRGVVLCVVVVVLVSDDRLNPWNGGLLFAEARLCDFTSSSLTQVPLGQTEHAVCHTLYVEPAVCYLVLGGGGAEPLTLLLLLLLLTYINVAVTLGRTHCAHCQSLPFLTLKAWKCCTSTLCLLAAVGRIVSRRAMTLLCAPTLAWWQEAARSPARAHPPSSLCWLTHGSYAVSSFGCECAELLSCGV